MRNNKKGFTLVELLAVIVILAVVMLIGITSIGPLMANSRKSALRSDGLDLMNAAKTAYQAEALKTTPAFTAIETVCMPLDWLKAQGYTENKQNYKGSVLVTYASGQYSYKYWIANGTYAFLGADENTGYDDKDKVMNYDDSQNNDLEKCGNLPSKMLNIEDKKENPADDKKENA